MPAKRRGKAVLIPSSPAYSFGTSHRPKPSSGDAPGPGTYNIHGDVHQDPSKGSRVTVRAQTMARGNVIGSTTAHPLSCNRSSPSFNIAGKPFPSGMLAKTPGPGDYNDSKQSVNPKHPAFHFSGSSVPDSRAGYPGPGKYNWGPNADKVHPSAVVPVSMKFRRAQPGDKMRRPGPDEYCPRDRLAIYKGEYTKCTMKFRGKGKLTESYPDPGPGEYNPQTTSGHRAPKYTIRLKFAAELDPPPYPGPGNYDVESSTIGNWGAGMAAHIPESPDIFLNERIEIFRRRAAPSPEYDAFLKQNRKKLMEMRSDERAHGASGAEAAGELGSKKPSSKGGKGRSKTGGRSQPTSPKSPLGNGLGSGLLVEQHLYDAA